MNVFSTTWTLAKASWRVLRKHRVLLCFPVMMLAASATLVMLFLPALSEVSGPGGGAILAVFFFLLHGIGVFFASALTCEALRALRQQPTSLAAGLACAAARLPSIAAMALIESTLGLFLSWLSRKTHPRRSGPRILGVAWKLMSYLAVPVLVAERRGAGASLMRSGRLLRQTWAHTTLGEFGLRAATVHFVLLLAVLLAMLSHFIDDAAAMLLITVALFAFAALAYTMQTIYRAALYIFVAEGLIPDDFEGPEMHRIWTAR